MNEEIEKLKKRIEELERRPIYIPVPWPVPVPNNPWPQPITIPAPIIPWGTITCSITAQ